MQVTRRRLYALQVGRRLTSITILSGSVVRVWGTLESLLERHQGMLSRNDRTMRCARVEFKDGDDVTALIGAPQYEIWKYYQTTGKAHRKVLQNSWRACLACLAGPLLSPTHRGAEQGDFVHGSLYSGLPAFLHMSHP